MGTTPLLTTTTTVKGHTKLVTLSATLEPISSKRCSSCSLVLITISSATRSHSPLQRTLHDQQCLFRLPNRQRLALLPVDSAGHRHRAIHVLLQRRKNIPRELHLRGIVHLGGGVRGELYLFAYREIIRKLDSVFGRSLHAG